MNGIGVVNKMDKLQRLSQEVEYERVLQQLHTLEVAEEKKECVSWLDIPEGEPTWSDKLMTVGVSGFLPGVTIASLFYMIILFLKM